MKKLLIASALAFGVVVHAVVAETVTYTANTVVSAVGAAVFTSDAWTFDFSGGKTPSVSFLGDVTLPSAVTVTLDGGAGAMPSSWTTIADLSAYAGSHALPDFTLTTTGCRLRIRDNCVQVKRARGTIVIVY